MRFVIVVVGHCSVLGSAAPFEFLLECFPGFLMLLYGSSSSRASGASGEVFTRSIRVTEDAILSFVSAIANV